MADFNIRSESVDVEQIMKQIRTRIREKRGVDYTEEQIRELATVRLEKFLDPKNLRSDLMEQFRKTRPALPSIPSDPPPVEPPYVFDDKTLFASHRGSLRFIRRLLMPILKLFINPNTLNQVLHAQAQFNIDMLKRDQRRKIEMQIFDRSRAEWNVLYYEVLHNLVLETTRNGIEMKNMKMRLEALASRLDFSERRVRALEGVVQYRPEAVRPRERERDQHKERNQNREQPRDRDRDQNRERERARERQTQPEPAPTNPSDVITDTASAPVAERAAVAERTTDASVALTVPDAPDTPDALGAAESSEPATRRRRRRRRGRRGTGLLPGVAAAGAEQNAAGENASGGDEGFDEGDEPPEGDGDTPSQAENDEPGSGTPYDPHQQ